MVIFFSASVANYAIQKQISIKYDNFFIDPQKIDAGLLELVLVLCISADSRGNLSVIYKNPQDLIIKLSDELVEPILVDIHDGESALQITIFALEFVLPPRFGLMSLPEAVLASHLLLKCSEFPFVETLIRICATLAFVIFVIYSID